MKTTKEKSKLAAVKEKELRKINARLRLEETFCDDRDMEEAESANFLTKLTHDYENF